MKCSSLLSRVSISRAVFRSLSRSPLAEASAGSLNVSKAYIDGSWVDGASLPVLNPADGSLVGEVPDLGAAHAQEAVRAADAAFASWSQTTAKKRADLLRRWFELCRSRQEDLATLLTLEQGKPLAEARGEIGYGSSYLEWFSEEARRNVGEVVPSPASSKQMLFLKEPLGVVGMITPWNFPNAMITRKVGAALAAGCTCVVKPSEDTPLSALALAKLAQEAGIPAGVFNVVTAGREKSAEVGAALCTSPLVQGISFTGSTRVGKILYKQSASTVKRLGLELGGNAAFIVFKSADLDQAVAGCMASKFRNAGQTCVSTNRVLVEEEVHDEFVGKLVAEMKASLVMGNGLTPGVTQGPLINKSQLDKVSGIVSRAAGEGAECVVGGSEAPHVGALHFSPTLLTGVASTSELAKDEIFGPVVSVTQFKGEEEALDIANVCRVGLASYFYSRDLAQCWRVGARLQTGMVGINEGLISAAEAAFGGVKESGMGREGSRHGLDDYTNIKYLCFGGL